MDRMAESINARTAELKRRLERKDATAPYSQNRGFAYSVRGGERVALECEIEHLQRLVHFINEATA